MTQSQTTATAAIVQIPKSIEDANIIDISRESTLLPLPEPSHIDKLRQKLRPTLLYVVSTAQFLDFVNGASVSIAILPIAEDLNFSPSQLPWILNAYTIAFAALLLFSGRMGDLFGHRRMFMFGLFWFATWALIVSFSTSPIMFVIARALQGIGAACTVPTAMALISINYPVGPERTRAFSIFSAFSGLGAVVGILMAGGFVSSIGWPWIFRVSSFAAYFLLLLGYLAIPLAPPKSEKPKVDYLGAAAATLAVTGIVYYITTGVDDGWASSKTLPVLFAGLLLFAVFIYTEYKVASPLMPLWIWKNRTFTASFILAIFNMAMFQGVIFYANMVFQEVYQWTALHTAVGFLVHSISAIVVFPLMGRVLPYSSLKPLIMAGFLLRCVTALLFSFVNEHASYWSFIFPAFIIHIVGVSMSMLPIQITAVRDAENKDQGLVGAIYSTGLQLGAPFGIAILNVISISTNGNSDGAVQGGPVLMKGYRNAFYGIIAMGLFAVVLALIILPWDKPAIRLTKKSVKTGTEQDGEIKDLEVGVRMEEAESVAYEQGGRSFKVDIDESTIAGQVEAVLSDKSLNA
ncbi:major facilitator superfamily domain-containing protein [Dissophora ornata]|nr:hypothetical protein BGZ58_007137 [Dissophora ornata]KAI8602177.1 major facilitator superfamily domain-containing protein [Dissophora ornata]